MDPVNIVGIDPGSGEFDCCLLKTGTSKRFYKAFSISRRDLASWLQWLEREEVEVVALEGSGGLCTPLEQALRETDIPFYSLGSYRVGKYRQALSGEHKSNRKDAAAVAGFASQLHAQGTLEEYRRTWFADPRLRSLVRMHQQKQREATREINRLWRTMHEVSGDLFLALRDQGAGKPGQSALTQRWVLKLISLYPDIYAWRAMSPQQLANSIAEHREAIKERIATLRNAVQDIAPLSPVESLKLQISASTALTLKQAADQLERMLHTETAKNPAAAALMRHPGIGPITSAQIVTEIIDIRRFKNNNKLAAYAGVARTETKTGRNTTERSQQLYNRRLKNAFYTAARSFTLFNPDSHLTGYYRHLRSQGMKNTEAYKRVARSLVRVFYRELLNAATNDSTARHEGNPEPSPERSEDHKQPHASPDISGKSSTSAPKREDAVAVAIGSNNSKKEVVSS
jgi:transposase